MLRFSGLLLLLSILSAPVAAEEWPAEARLQMEAAGARLKAATTTGERVEALREIELIASTYPDATGAQATARLMAEKATQEAGPAKMLAALGELAAAGEITDAETFGSIAAPLMAELAEMRENDTLLPAAAIQLDAAIKRIDAAAKKANLPTLAEAVDRHTGDTALAGKTVGAIGKIAALAKLANETPNLQQMNEKARKDYIDTFFSALPPSVAPALSQSGGVVIRDTLVWNGEMYGEATKALDLVAEAIETGRFDHAAYGRIRDRLKELSKGPWGSDTAKDFLKKLCASIPVAGIWCGDAFNLVEELISGVDCDAITCDCENVGGGLMKGPLIVQCKIQEQTLIDQCKATREVSGTCIGDAKGPGASH